MENVVKFETNGRHYELPTVHHDGQGWFQSYYVEKAERIVIRYDTHVNFVLDLYKLARHVAGLPKV